ncbi:MAG TPA: nickel pincer cofactor biosynthesis protein LarC [Gemmatimonadaceae bacterium]|nr:nickel pincer cofactor biosynthesis protein LarC [Gemmatimonadaceae bacterium]
MTIAILDPFSGIAGDMTLGALIDVGLSEDWLRALPARLGLEDVHVRIERVARAGIACVKVDFDIPSQPHGRHLSAIRGIVDASDAPPLVKERANAAFTLIAEQEAAIHGVTVERVHLHEVGAVDAILDVLGSIWGLHLLGVSTVYCGAIALGDGFVDAAHGRLPVPAPATLRLLEGLPVRPGPEGSGELVTPTGAALVRVLSAGPPPSEWTPVRSGYGAGTKEFPGRANALRIVLAEPALASGAGMEEIVMLATDVDDMTAERIAGAVDRIRAAGALDVFTMSTQMKKGRTGTRIEVLAAPADTERLESLVFEVTSTLGVRRSTLARHALTRQIRSVGVLGHQIRVKIAARPDGVERAKPEDDDVRDVANATGRAPEEIAGLAAAAWERR